MKSVGIATTVVASVLVAGAVAMGVASIPDIKRYLKIRSM